MATTNPHAAFATPRSEAFLRRPGPENRPMAFPYAKWHSTQWTVNQAGALLLCSAEAALRHGVPRDRWVFPLVALESSYVLTLSGRREMARWPAMRVLGAAAAGHLGRPLAEVDHVELYSCFPAAVRVQQRELGLPLDGVPTVTGGMAFAGGPFNNFTYQATAAVVERLRAAVGRLGLVTTVSGLLTKPGLMVWSTEPGPAADRGPGRRGGRGHRSSRGDGALPGAGSGRRLHRHLRPARAGAGRGDRRHRRRPALRRRSATTPAWPNGRPRRS